MFERSLATLRDSARLRYDTHCCCAPPNRRKVGRCWTAAAIETQPPSPSGHLRAFISSQNNWRAVFSFEPLTSAIEKLLVSDEVPLGALILEFHFDQRSRRAKIDDRPLEIRLNNSFDCPSLSSEKGRPVDDLGPGLVHGVFDGVLALAPGQAKGRADLFRDKIFVSDQQAAQNQ